MAIDTTHKNGVLTTVQNIVSRRGAHRDELIPILNEVNHAIGFLPSDALQEVARLLQIPRSSVFSVATFYEMLNTQERGRHVVLFCESAPCHVVGGREVWTRLRRELSLEAGETSPDKKWSLVTVSCLGVCGVGPVVIVDDDMHGNVTPDMIPGILARYE
jgi:NADH:ubiquinone oxidoreductase subunit E